MTLLAGVILLVATACTEEVPHLTQDDSGTDVVVEPGDVIEVELASDRSAGYRWKVASVPEILEPVHDRYRGPPQDDLDGPGSQTLTFEVVGDGTGVLRLEYVRPSDAPTTAEQAVEYVVRADVAVSPDGRATAPTVDPAGQ